MCVYIYIYVCFFADRISIDLTLRGSTTPKNTTSQRERGRLTERLAMVGHAVDGLNHSVGIDKIV